MSNISREDQVLPITRGNIMVKKQDAVLWSLLAASVLFMSFAITAAVASDSTVTVADIDGNVYKTIKIGEQWWMAENLRVIHYRNGDAIPHIAEGTWSVLTTGAYCNYDNDVNHVTTYGRLYNWLAVNDNRNIAPIGWHVASDAEWQILVHYLGGDAVAGGKMKEAGLAHWALPNTGATNESGFSALPGGCRDFDSKYDGVGGYAFFWSSTEKSRYHAWSQDLYYKYSGIISDDYSNKSCGYSVRCVKD
jgi:uncharacterized protein (TIGR02145 family)